MPGHHVLFVLSFLPALAALLAPSTTRAEEPTRPFGSRGQVALDDIVSLSAGGSPLGYPLVLPLGSGSGSFGLGYSGIAGYTRSTTSRTPGQPGGNESTTDMVWLAPSLDVFVGSHFSIGGTVAASYARGSQEVVKFDGRTLRSEGSGFGFAIAPRVGYVVPLGASFALWPRLTLAYGGGDTEYEGETPDAAFLSSNRSIRGIAELGLVARIHRYVYLRAAPSLVVAASRSGGTTSAAILSTDDQSFTVRLGATAGLGILLGN
ncbi:hypothetical protein [Polyangium sorediatum]|uniref:Outer membrane protein beta-barrel domain-containing protein n=1 Tax=Polyangium sorediatum TaxID=889274 RepID=A0ABT6NT52_9BACT|nr:hypothetical protein [Polyangium sorediatum]MDI1431482.1 hypothetical protein [Polyangium sorediatum]